MKVENEEVKLSNVFELDELIKKTKRGVRYFNKENQKWEKAFPYLFLEKDLTQYKFIQCKTRKVKKRFYDIINTETDHVKILNFSHVVKKDSGNNTYFYRYQCKACGKEDTTSRQQLKSKKFVSCGCLNKSLPPPPPRKSDNPLWQGYEEISGNMFRRIKRGAQTRKLPFYIDIKFLWKLYLKQDKKCALSGLDIGFSPVNNSTEGTASLDRIDSSHGYYYHNVQWVHKAVNRLKGQLADDTLISLCRRITETTKNKVIPVVNSYGWKS